MSLSEMIASIERCAFAAWPAAEVEPLAGWRLRAMSGVTRRANSVWACEAFGPLGLEERIEQVETFYGARGLPSLLQVTPVSVPAGLDAELERRGYRIDAPVSVQIAEPRRVLAGASAQRCGQVEVSRGPSERWLDVSVRQGRYADVEASYRGLLARLGRTAHYALASVDGEAVAVALGIAAGEWFGICSMLTLTAHRRRGLGGSLISALAETALQSGCHSLYLQVETSNMAARALYSRAGFAPLYGTHYRLRDLQPGPRP
jgi:GNAT superfamily N-acetyltransferase